MSDKPGTFTKAELRVMRLLWDKGSASVADVMSALPPPPLAYTTVLTVLRVLERKGAVAHEERGRAHVYRPLVPRDEAERGAIGDVVSSFFANSKMALAVRLLSEERPSNEELERIKSLIAGYEAKRK
jgi:predicted transcriptional regulator